MSITALPDIPQRSDPATFSTKADAFLGALPTFVTEANALEINVNAKEVSAAASAAAALASKNAAAVSEEHAAEYTGAPQWVSGTTYSLGDCVWSPVDHGIYRRIVPGAGTTDPSADAANWVLVSLGPGLQNDVFAALLGAMDMAALANRELDRFRRVRIQEGETIIYNRGVIAGGVVTRKDASERVLSLAEAKVFMNGRSYSVPANTDAVTVPGNSGVGQATCSVYLYVASGAMVCGITALGAAVPSTGLALYTVSVPTGSTAGNGAFTITNVRRIEALWPNAFVNPTYASIALPYVLPDAKYAVHLDVVSCVGGRQQIGGLEVEDRLNNGFKIYLAGAADAVTVRYHVQRMI